MHHLFHNLLRKLFIAIGHDIFRDGEFKPYFHTYKMYALLALFLAGSIKTLAFYNLKTVLNMIAFLGVACEVIFVHDEFSDLLNLKYYILVSSKSILSEIWKNCCWSYGQNYRHLRHEFENG